MTGITVDKIVVELDYEVSPHAQSELNRYEKSAENIKSKISGSFKDMSSGFKKAASSDKLSGSIGSWTRRYTETVGARRIKDAQELKKLFGKTPSKEEEFFIKLEGQALSEDELPGVWKRRMKDEKELKKLFEKTGSKKIEGMRFKLAEQGFKTSNMNDEEIFKTDFNMKREKYAEKEEKKKADGEKKKNRETMAEERARTRIIGKTMRMFGIATRGFIGFSFARAFTNRFSKIIERASDLQTTAAMSNMSPQRAQATEEWFSAHNIDPKAGMRTLESYANFMNLKNMPYDKILSRMIKESKKGSLRAGVEHGGDPTAIRVMRQYGGNLNEELYKFQKESFGDKELKSLERAQYAMYRIKKMFDPDKFMIKFLPIIEAIADLSEKMMIPLGKVGDFLNESVKKIESFFKGFKTVTPDTERTLSDEENYAEHMRVSGKKFPKIRTITDELPDENDTAATNNGGINNAREKNNIFTGNKNTRNITVTNNFSIRSTDPERAASEVQSLLTRGLFEKIDSVRPSAVR